MVRAPGGRLTAGAEGAGYTPGAVSIRRAFVIGFVTGVLQVALAIAGITADGLVLLALVLLPVVFLAGAAVLGTGRTGRLRRAIRGVLGAIVAVAAGVAAVLLLMRWTRWLDWPDEHGGDLFLMLLAALAAVSGGTAAAAASPGQGLALGGGFTLGVTVPLMLVGTPSPAFAVMLTLGTLVGTLVSALGRR